MSNIENKETAIKFNKWLFDNNFVPNKSFLWFDHTAPRERIKFFEPEDLYNFFINNLPLPEQP